jgi:hypothetical protein
MTVLRIRVTLMRIRILLFTLIRIRISSGLIFLAGLDQESWRDLAAVDLTIAGMAAIGT